MNNRQLVIYNLETNLDSFVLASAHDWVEEFSRKYKQVYVFSTHVGRTILPRNVHIVETGGGNVRNRVLAILRLIFSIWIIARKRKSTDVFHHMSSRTLLLLGLPIRILGVPQIIWYSHSIADGAMKLGARFANLVVSSTEGSVPKLIGIKVIPIGHGIATKRLENSFASEESIRNGLICVGRVVKIKRIEELLIAISRLEPSIKSKVAEVELIGPYDKNSKDFNSLKKVSEQTGVKLFYTGPLRYAEIPGVIKNASLLYSGTPKSVDKAAIEAAMLGTLILSTNASVQELTGMKTILPSEEIATDLTKQLAWMLTLPEVKVKELRSFVANSSTWLNSLDKLVGRIEYQFMEIRSNRNIKYAKLRKRFG